MHYRVVMQVDFGYMSTELYWYEGHMSNLDAETASTHTRTHKISSSRFLTCACVYIHLCDCEYHVCECTCIICVCTRTSAHAVLSSTVRVCSDWKARMMWGTDETIHALPHTHKHVQMTNTSLWWHFSVLLLAVVLSLPVYLNLKFISLSTHNYCMDTSSYWRKKIKTIDIQALKLIINSACNTQYMSNRDFCRLMFQGEIWIRFSC